MAFTALEALKKAQQYTPPEAAEEGDYTLQIRKIDSKMDKHGSPYFLVVLKNEDEPKAADVFHNLGLPDGGEYDDMRSDMLQRFANSFGFGDDLTVLVSDPETLYGNTGRVHLALEEDDNGTIRNRIKRYL